tara:strand:- start:18544 stop:19686 length:1143 start_codon:yes stop_codon:yes gene_type:complete
MKKILVINTKYKQFGGEDSNIIDELKFLKNYYEVEYLEYDNSEKLSLFDFLAFITSNNINSNRLLVNKVESFKPDMIYVHNTWFKANIGILKLLIKSKIPTILKIHNFRFECTNYFFAKNHYKKEFCPRCGNYKKRFQIFNKYFQDSYLRSLFVIIYGKKYYKILKNNPFHIFVLNNFYKKHLVDILKINEKKISISYNQIEIKDRNAYKSKSNYVIYAGAISRQKGLDYLLDSWVKSNTALDLIIIGEGKFKNIYEEKYDKKNIKFYGYMKNEDVLNLIRKSRAVITATLMNEAQPRILFEASANGIPSIFPSFGGMDEYFPKNYELSFEQFNYKDLEQKIKKLNDKSNLEELSIDVLEHVSNLLDHKGALIEFEKNIK